MNSQHQNTNLKGDFVLKKPGLNVLLKDFWYIKIDPTQIWYDKYFESNIYYISCILHIIFKTALENLAYQL